MLSFKQYLKEEFLIEGTENTDKGIMFELEYQRHMHPKKEFPQDFRTENPKHKGKSAAEVHKSIKSRLTPEQHKTIQNHAKAAAEHTKKLLKDHDVEHVTWSSNRDTEKSAGDHEKLTKKKDVNQKADTILTVRHKKTKKLSHVPVSLKYGHHEPNVDNPGAKELEKEGGHKEGKYSKIWAEHESRMEKLGYSGSKEQRHAQFKSHREALEKEKEAHRAKGGKPGDFKPKSTAAKKAHEAYASAALAKTAIARHHEKGLANKSDKELRKTVMDAANPPTHLKTLLVHAQTNKKDSNATVHAGYAEDKVNNHLNKYKNLRVRKGEGGNVNIVGTHKDTGEEHVVASRGIKMGNGPHKGFNGTFKLGARASKDEDED